MDTTTYTADKLAREMDGFIFSSWNALEDFDRAAQQAGLVLVLVTDDECTLCGVFNDFRVLARFNRTVSFPICQGGFYPDWEFTIDMNSVSEMEKVLEKYFVERSGIDKLTVYPVASGNGWRVEISVKSIDFTMLSREYGKVVGLVVELRDLTPSLW